MAIFVISEKLSENPKKFRKIFRLLALYEECSEPFGDIHPAQAFGGILRVGERPFRKTAFDVVVIQRQCRESGHLMVHILGDVFPIAVHRNVEQRRDSLDIIFQRGYLMPVPVLSVLII